MKKVLLIVVGCLMVGICTAAADDVGSYMELRELLVNNIWVVDSSDAGISAKRISPESVDFIIESIWHFLFDFEASLNYILEISSLEIRSSSSIESLLKKLERYFTADAIVETGSKNREVVYSFNIEEYLHRLLRYPDRFGSPQFIFSRQYLVDEYLVGGPGSIVLKIRTPIAFISRLYNDITIKDFLLIVSIKGRNLDIKIKAIRVVKTMSMEEAAKLGVIKALKK